jgi:acetyltransferase EpsM
MPTQVTIPLLNPNEPEAVLAALHVREGQRVAAGDLLCTLETTKSAADLTAEQAGYVIGLRGEQGQVMQAGERLCYLAEELGWSPPETDTAPAQAPAGEEKPPEGLRITQPALTLARRLGVDLQRLPLDRLVTESMVRGLLSQPTAGPDLAPPASAFDPQAIVVYGGGGHGKTLIELLRLLGTYQIAGVIDDGLAAGTQVLGLPVLGGAEALLGLYERGVRLAVNAVGGIGNLAIRLQVFHRLNEAGFVCPAVVHPRAVVEASAVLAAGVQVFAQAYIGSEARVGFGGIVNTGAIISHDCLLGDYVNISPGAILAGEVQVGSGALVGMGATVNLQVKIGAGARIGNGATVKADVPEKGIVRAGAIWPE